MHLCTAKVTVRVVEPGLRERNSRQSHTSSLSTFWAIEAYTSTGGEHRVYITWTRRVRTNHKGVCCKSSPLVPFYTATEVGFGRGAGPTLATIMDGGVIGFTGTARPVWLDLLCLANHPGVLMLSCILEPDSAVTVPRPDQFFRQQWWLHSWLDDVAPSSTMSDISGSCARAGDCDLRCRHYFKWVADASVPVHMLLLSEHSLTAFPWHIRFCSRSITSLRLWPLAMSGFSAFSNFLTSGALWHGPLPEKCPGSSCSSPRIQVPQIKTSM